MQYDQRIENIAAGAVKVVKWLVIIYLGVEEVFKIRKSLKKKFLTSMLDRLSINTIMRLN